MSFKQFPLLKICVVFIGFFFLVAILAPWIMPTDPFKQNLRERFAGPTYNHLLGTDGFGRDILSRLILGTRPSVSMAFLSITLALFMGVPIGLLGAYEGGVADGFVAGLADILLSLPSYVMGVLVSASLGVGTYKAIIAVGLAFVGRYLRLTRGSTLSVKGKTYVMASRASGAGTRRILFVHILPNISSELIVMTTVWIGSAMLVTAGLSFLGLGAQPPMPSWGRMLREGTDKIYFTPWLAIFPGLAISLFALLFNIAGDELQDFLNPKIKRYGR